MDQEKKNAIALMRYSVIAPLITGLSDDYNSLTAFLTMPLPKVLCTRMVQ